MNGAEDFDRTIALLAERQWLGAGRTVHLERERDVDTQEVFGLRPNAGCLQVVAEARSGWDSYPAMSIAILVTRPTISAFWE